MRSKYDMYSYSEKVITIEKRKKHITKMKRIWQNWKKSVFAKKDKLLEDFSVVLSDFDNDVLSLQDMPDEVLLIIVKFLDIETLLKCSHTCQRIR